jgi:hypothetical protein
VETKTCLKCGEEKPTDDFYLYRRSCKKCMRAYQRDFAAARPHYHRNRNLLSRYGISGDEYQTLLANQNFACPICEVEISETLEYKGKRSVVVDHNHDTGEVRGVLCSGCNLVLGHARENTTILYKAIVYLSERGAYTPKGK